MATNRMESTGAATADAPAAAAPAESSPAPAGLKAWLPLIITVLVMPVLAYAMTNYVLLPRLQHGLGIKPVAAAEEKGEHKTSTSAKKESFAIDKLLVNVAGTLGQRYLLVSLSIVGGDADFKTRLQDVKPQLQDLACGALATKTLADLEKPEARNLIKTELITRFNNLLGGPVIQDIYFTEFAIQ